MIFTLPWLVSYVSRYITMEEGDILITGTPEGVSEIKPGDTVVARIQNVGTLTNTVRSE
jgi:5-oxopent-3-ene-1,2,5-tricarboxylate decarboxylase/2-hydroxyhepta-2,4-diene-1,7-dioate isomerase